MSDCRTCIHYHAPIEPLRRLAVVLPADAELGGPLLQLAERDREQVHLELAERQRALESGRDDWLAVPRNSAWCTPEGEVCIPEVRNDHGQCHTFDPAPRSPEPSCASCVHRRPAPGWVYDAELERQADATAALAATVGFPAAGSAPVREMLVAARTAELEEAFERMGRMTHEPRYFDACAASHTPGTWRLCAVERAGCTELVDADASLDLYCTMCTVARGGHPAVTGDVRIRWRNALAGLWPTLSDSERAYFEAAVEIQDDLDAARAAGTLDPAVVSAELAGLDPLGDVAFSSEPAGIDASEAWNAPTPATRWVAHEYEQVQHLVQNRMQSDLARDSHDSMMGIIGAMRP